MYGRVGCVVTVGITWGTVRTVLISPGDRRKRACPGGTRGVKTIIITKSISFGKTMPRKKTTEEFIAQVKEIHGDKYDYSKVVYTKSLNKVIIICSTHGEFKQTANNHLRGKGCPGCSGNKKLTTNEFISRARKVHSDKYDYSKTVYTKSLNKVIIICTTHGEFNQTASNHLRNTGCPGCSGNKKKTTDEFIVQAREVHGDKYDYSKVEYETNRDKVIIICSIHGEFEQVANSHLQGVGCPGCSGNTKKTTDEFIVQAKEIHGDKYDYSKVEYGTNRDKVIITCREHGEFEQISSSHLKGVGCPGCSGNKKKTTDEFIVQAREVHGDKYDYSKVEYKSAHFKVVIFCSIHGEFEQVANSHLHGMGCSRCYGNKKKTTDEFIVQAREVHGDKYDYSKVEYETNRDKVIIICSIHGEFIQVASNHLRGMGCSGCSGNKKKTTDEFIAQAIEIHGDKYYYNKVEYGTNCDKVIIICRDHGEFEQIASSHLQGLGCLGCSGNKKKTTDEFIVQAREVHGDKYEYNKVEYKSAHCKVIIICKVHEIEFNQSPHSHLQDHEGCHKCRKTCVSCGIFESTLNNRKKCEYCRPHSKLREKTKEMKVLKILREHFLEYTFIHNKSVGRDCVDNVDKENEMPRKGHLYPDIRIDLGFYQLIVEVDEFKHRGANYECDERRMRDIVGELGQSCVFIRYNPDSKDSATSELIEKVEKYLVVKEDGPYPWDEHGLCVEYLFY